MWKQLNVRFILFLLFLINRSVSADFEISEQNFLQNDPNSVGTITDVDQHVLSSATYS